MTRQEFEKELALRLEDIRALYQRYNPTVFEKGKAYLSMFISENHMHANNRCGYSDEEGNNDDNAPCDFWIDEEGEMHSQKMD